MCYKRNELTIIGLSSRADICQTLGVSEWYGMTRVFYSDAGLEPTGNSDHGRLQVHIPRQAKDKCGHASGGICVSCCRHGGLKKTNLLKEKPLKGYMLSGGRLTKIQTTTTPDHVWPEVWTKIGKTAQNRV